MVAALAETFKHYELGRASVFTHLYVFMKGSEIDEVVQELVFQQEEQKQQNANQCCHCLEKRFAPFKLYFPILG